MGRTVATVWHVSFSIAAGALYFLFVVPRWPELMGETSHALGTALRIVTGVLIGLAALPVVFTLLRTRKPEYGTPRLALTLRTWSVVGHVLAGAVLVGTAISEIWLSLDTAGQWLFGIYGAAAAVAVLGFSGFYLSFVAELPPPPPAPRRRLRRKKDFADGAETDEEASDSVAESPADAEAADAEAADAEAADDEAAETDAEATGDEGDLAADAAEDAEDVEETEAEAAETAEQDDVAAAPAQEPESTAEAESSTDAEPPAAEDTVAAAAPSGGLRNRRPTGKAGSRRRRRTRGGVAVED